LLAVPLRDIIQLSNIAQARTLGEIAKNIPLIYFSNYEINTN